MDKPISVGDLVMVVKTQPCCGNGKEKSIGKIYTVLKLVQSSGCTGCSEKHIGKIVAYDKPMSGYLIFRLKRIPPLSELEDVKVHETIDA